MNQVEQAQKEMVRPLAEQYYAEFLNSDSYEMMEKDSEMTKEEKEMVTVLEIYTKIQDQKLLNDIKKMASEDSLKSMIEMMYDLGRAVIYHESELYQLMQIRSESERTLSCDSVFYSMTSNDNVNIIQTIEEVVREKSNR